MSLDLLSDELAQNKGLGEILGAHDDAMGT
jgi:hypothetical protein